MAGTMSTALGRMDGNKKAEACAMSWMLWAPPDQDQIATIAHEVDRIFASFSYYREQDYARYMFRPPDDGSAVVGAWRDPETVAFVFLTTNPRSKNRQGGGSLILSYDGERYTLVPYLPQIKKLKRELASKNKQMAIDKNRQTRLERVQTSRLLVRLVALMGPVTMVINALALYLRKIEPPTIRNVWLSALYLDLLPMVYIMALVLLLVFTVICILYIFKYGLLLVTRV